MTSRDRVSLMLEFSNLPAMFHIASFLCLVLLGFFFFQIYRFHFISESIFFFFLMLLRFDLMGERVE